MITSYKLDTGEEFTYIEKPIEEFRTEGGSEGNVRYRFYHQREKFEEGIIENITDFDIEDWAKDEFNLVDEYEVKGLDDYSDDEIKKAA